MKMANATFANPIFQAALTEIEGLGFRVSERPRPGAKPYGVIGGRSNQRWWLIPLDDSRWTISGLAMFQPIVASARVIKSAAVIASKLGLASTFLRDKVYISEPAVFEDIFLQRSLSYSFFSGTDSPHRKVAVQVMDRDGTIKGFAKVSRNQAVKSILAHEAETLHHIHTLDLTTVLTPTTLFCGNIGGVLALVTDSLKTARSKSTTIMREAHVNFLRELAEKTVISTGDNAWEIAELYSRYEAMAERLPLDWRQRFEKALDYLSKKSGGWGLKVLSHGDFTPWNTFFVNDHLYVFDWEYAHNHYPVGYDLVHFVFSLPAIANQAADIALAQVRQQLSLVKIGEVNILENSCLFGYLCAHSLFYFAREVEAGKELPNWGGGQRSAEYIDCLLKAP
jgi:hypothetical protein